MKRQDSRRSLVSQESAGEGTGPTYEYRTSRTTVVRGVGHGHDDDVIVIVIVVESEKAAEGEGGSGE